MFVCSLNLELRLYRPTEATASCFSLILSFRVALHCVVWGSEGFLMHGWRVCSYSPQLTYDVLDLLVYQFSKVGLLSSTWKEGHALYILWSQPIHNPAFLPFPCDRRKELRSVWQKRMILWSSCLHLWQVRRHSYKQQPSLKIFWVLKRWAVSSGRWLNRWGNIYQVVRFSTLNNVEFLQKKFFHTRGVKLFLALLRYIQV